MAETNVDTAAETTADSRGLRTQVVVGTTTVYQFFIDSGTDLMYRKSTDGGVNWGAKATIKLATVIAMFDVWYDKWTPGDTGTKIHITYTNVTSVHDTLYNSLDTASADALSGEVVVHDGSSYTATGGSWVQNMSITKAVGGNLYIGCNPDGGAEEHFYRSTDGGVNWTSRATLYEATADRAILFPADTSDTQDIAAAYWDVSANAWSMKMYDDSANTWTETAGASATESSAYFQMAGAIRHSDQHLILVVWNDINAAGADLLCYDITLDAIDLTGKITAKTNVITNSANCFGCTVSINQYNDDIYVSMLGKSDGSETFESLVHVYYCRSTDGGTTWTQQIIVSTTQDDHRAVWSDPGSGSTGLFLPVWFNDDLNDLLCDTALSVVWGRTTGLTASSSNTDATSYTTETVLIGPSDRGYLLCVQTRKGTTPDTPTVSGWTQVLSCLNETGLNRLTIFERYGNDTPASFTIDYGGNTQLNCQWAFHELNDINLTDMIVQSKTDLAATGTTLNITFDAAFGSASNMTFGAIISNGITTDDYYSPDSNMLELKEISATGLEAGHMMTQWKNGEEATVTFTATVNANHGYAILEIGDVAFSGSTVVKDLLGGGFIAFPR